MKKFKVYLTELSGQMKMKTVDLSNGAPKPTQKVAKGEKVIGGLPHELRKSWVVLALNKAELEKQCEIVGRRHEELEACPAKANPARDKALALEHFYAHRRHQLVSVFFDHAVRETFPEAGATSASLEVRKGWKVVIPRSSQGYFVRIISHQTYWF